MYIISMYICNKSYKNLRYRPFVSEKAKYFFFVFVGFFCKYFKN